jgi:hypothetical protein
MPKRIAILCLLLSVATSAPASETQPISTLYGKWILTGVAETPFTYPAGCRFSITLKPDGSFVSRIGPARFTGSYDIGREDAGYRIRFGNLDHTGKPDCRGYSTNFVTQHLKAHMHIAPMDHNAILFYPSSEDRRRYLILIRQE